MNKMQILLLFFFSCWLSVILSGTTTDARLINDHHDVSIYHQRGSLILTGDVEPLMQAMKANPPDWLPIHIGDYQKYLKRPNLAREKKKRLRLGRLLRAIMAEHKYQNIEQVGSWLIFKRDAGAKPDDA